MILRQLVCRSPRACSIQRHPLATTRCLSQSALHRLSRPLQTYISASRDPYLNLSIEHHLLQKSPPDSAVLFLYVNRPSIIIGRNQNPWLEVNLPLLQAGRQGLPTEPSGIGAVDLVRRRSGGGTVFHDEGNVNWTVICPSATFTRDKHAEMVVRALRSCGIDRARVNARHDIVLDQGQRGSDTDPDDTHSTPYEATDFDTPRPFKVSGSAYKLTGKRALHHGTCLLNSPNLNVIPHYLHSPAKPFMTARGVESVSSPVGNVLLSNDDFIGAVQERFAKEYELLTSDKAFEVGDEWLEDGDVKKGYDELKSMDWIYLQTPQFTISIDAALTDEKSLDISVRYGAINGATLDGSPLSEKDQAGEILLGQKIHEIKSWAEIIQRAGLPFVESPRISSIAQWLEQMLPRDAVRPAQVVDIACTVLPRQSCGSGFNPVAVTVLNVEMMVYSIMYLWAYSCKPYKNRMTKIGLISPYLGFWRAVWDICNPWDILEAIGRSARLLYIGPAVCGKKREEPLVPNGDSQLEFVSLKYAPSGRLHEHAEDESRG
ncbi:hypothetical protein AC578_83 [Pseudocercospora eumusae]|uniref:Putative lipoate-protein ligase A n=1 Tax=Pseudocercospora eumusae TaxID=321146 RepID=A0A139HPA3_9PEZI|nr:hypothetical protein AC578_83 [Pseudocercospora eumusae]